MRRKDNGSEAVSVCIVLLLKLAMQGFGSVLKSNDTRMVVISENYVFEESGVSIIVNGQSFELYLAR